MDAADRPRTMPAGAGVRGFVEAAARTAHTSPPVRRMPAPDGRIAEVLCEVDLDGAQYVLSRFVQERAAAGLSRREREIAVLVAAGLPTKAIAARLRISPWTVSTHLRRIFARFAVDSRAAMVARLFEQGLL